MSADHRPLAQRRRDTEHRLAQDIDVWVASPDRELMRDGRWLVVEAGQIEAGDADGDCAGGPARQMETR